MDGSRDYILKYSAFAKESSCWQNRRGPGPGILTVFPSLDLAIHFSAECLTSTIVEGLHIWYAGEKRLSHV